MELKKNAENRQLREPSWKDLPCILLKIFLLWLLHQFTRRTGAIDPLKKLCEQPELKRFSASKRPSRGNTAPSARLPQGIAFGIAAVYSTCWPTHLRSPSQGSAELDLTRGCWDADSSIPREGQDDPDIQKKLSRLICHWHRWDPTWQSTHKSYHSSQNQKRVYIYIYLVI